MRFAKFGAVSLSVLFLALTAKAAEPLLPPSPMSAGSSEAALPEGSGFAEATSPDGGGAASSDLESADPEDRLRTCAGMIRYCGEGFYFESDVLFLDRDNRGSQALVVNTFTGATLLSNSDLHFDTAFAPRFTIGRQITDCISAEVTYFGVIDMNAGNSVTGQTIPTPAGGLVGSPVNGFGTLAIPGALGQASTDFIDANRIGVAYNSRLDSVEANFVFDNCGFKLLGGFRYLSINETYDINAVNDAGSDGTSDYLTRTHNDLYGVQGGVRIDRQIRPRLIVEITAKAGLYGNTAFEGSTVRDQNNTVLLRNASASGGNAAFVGEIECASAWKLTNWLTFRSSANFMSIEGVALAPNQLDFTFASTSGTQLNSQGGLFLYGGSVGLEARW